MDDVGWQVAFAIDSCRRVQRAERRLEKAKADLEVAVARLSPSELAEYARQTGTE